MFRQREMERNIRHTKTKLITLREGIGAAQNDEVKAELEREYAKTAKLLGRQNQAYNDFCKENGLKRFDDRLQTAKWTREDAKKSMLTSGKSVSADRKASNTGNNGVALSPGEGVTPTDAPKQISEQQAAESALTDTKHGHSLDGYTPEQQKEIRHLLDNAPPLIKKLYAMYGNKLQAVDEYVDPEKGNAYYNPEDNHVHMHRADTINGNHYQEPYQMHFHEYAHNLDYLAGRRITGQNVFYSTVYRNAEGKSLEDVIMDDWKTSMKTFYKDSFDKPYSSYAKSLQLDIGKSKLDVRSYTHGLITRWQLKAGLPDTDPSVISMRSEIDSLKDGKLLREFYQKHFDKFGDLVYNVGETIKSFIKYIKDEYPLKDSGNLSDMFERFAVQNINETYENPFGVGHGAEYAMAPDNLNLEGIADMMDSTVVNPVSLALIKQYVPNAYDMFFEMLRRMLE